MKSSTQLPLSWDAAYEGTRPAAVQAAPMLPPIASALYPIKRTARRGLFEEHWPADALLARTQVSEESFSVPRPVIRRESDVGQDSSVLQLWEGRVLEVRPEEGLMDVILTAKIGSIPTHSAEIELQWVPDQDRDLVRPGAVFYLTLYKRTRRGSIANAQELRFRRLPAWTKQQVAQIEREGRRLLSKMKPRPIAE